MTELLLPKSWQQILQALALGRQAAWCLGHYTRIITWSKSLTCPCLRFPTAEGQSNAFSPFLSAYLGVLVHAQKLSLTSFFSFIQQPCMSIHTHSVPVPSLYNSKSK